MSRNVTYVNCRVILFIVKNIVLVAGNFVFIFGTKIVFLFYIIL